MRAESQGSANPDRKSDEAPMHPSLFGGGARQLSRWIIAATAILALLFMAATAAVVLTLHNSLVEHEKSDLRNLALVLAEETDRSFQSVEMAQRALLNDIERFKITTPDAFNFHMASKDVRTVLRNNIAALPHISELGIGAVDGNLVNTTATIVASANGPLSSNAAEAFRSNAQLRVAVTRPVRIPASDSFGFNIARKLTDTHGHFLGTINGVIHLDYLERYFERIKPSPSSTIALFREDGTLLVRIPRKASVIGRSFPGIRDSLVSGDAVEVRGVSPIDGTDKLMAVRRLPNHPVFVVVTASVADAMAVWRQAAVYLVGAAAIVLVAIGIVVFIGTRRLASNINAHNAQFSSAINNTAKGLLIFDEQARVVVGNEGYLRMYNMPAQVARPGAPLRDLLNFRKAAGTFKGDPAEYQRRVLDEVGKGFRTEHTLQVADGRTIRVVNEPIPGGGYISTHEDVTESTLREESFRLLFDNNPIAMWVFDRDTLEFLAVNDAAIEQYGYDREKFLQLSVLDIRPVEDRERFAAFVRSMPKRDTGRHIRRHQRADGSIFEVCSYSHSLHHEGREARLVASVDVTEQRTAEADLRRAQKFLDTVIEHVPLPIIVKRVPPSATNARDCSVTLVNRAAENLYGIERDKWIGRSSLEIYPNAAGELSMQLDTKALLQEGPLVSGDHSIETTSGATKLVTSQRVAIRSDAGLAEYLVVLLEDVTERREAENRIAYMAHHDRLTDLANRVAFDECFAATIANATAQNTRIAVMCLDLDGFKEINDLHGHSAGDHVLREVAGRLSATATDAFVARFGGDEFMLITPDDEDGNVSRELASRLLSAVAERIDLDGQSLHVGLSIGIAVYPEHGMDTQSLLANADLALYRAKGHDRGTAQYFNSEMDVQVRERRAMQEDLRHAIAAGEFTLYYQPQVSMRREVIGYEALARWNSPKYGNVSPAVFIPLAEESGLIVQLGEWILREACREAASWPEPKKVAVNISPRQFQQGNLPEIVLSALLRANLSPSLLELEITEGVLIDDFSRAVSILKRLKAIGVDIALDDFGTGYSSLSYLHSFSFDKIKIDRAFIMDLERNMHSQAIVRAVIGLGRSLNIPILAEGVETEEQLTMLAREGCDAVQGYLTGRPQSAETLFERGARRTA